MIELIERAAGYGDHPAIISDETSHSYRQLLSRSQAIAHVLCDEKEELEEARIAFLIPSGFDYVSVQWGIWQAGGIAVPLSEKHPLPAIEYILDDTQASHLIFDPQFATLLAPFHQRKNLKMYALDELRSEKKGALPEILPYQRAMILYTSGTTGQPKGVVTTHANIQTQIESLIEAWEWSPDDHILNVLPMHHVHGIINVTSCALWSGATCTCHRVFDPQAVFDLIRTEQLTLFMAVPTIYHKLIAYWQASDASTQQKISQSLSKLRLMVSGSAALPVSVLTAWQSISGHTLLERYGMTEIGMAISNPYRGERKPGFIGQPLPHVEVRLVDDNQQPVTAGESGEIQVKGPNVFKEYWQKSETTAASFTADGWFRTGDVALHQEGSYRIIGRSSVDIIKSGGYKVSALEIEEVLRTHPQIADCGVVGLPDEEWGEVIAAAVVVAQPINSNELGRWLKQRLPGYKVPRRFIQLDDLPRNAMGKVTKKELKERFLA